VSLTSVPLWLISSMLIAHTDINLLIFVDEINELNIKCKNVREFDEDLLSCSC